MQCLTQVIFLDVSVPLDKYINMSETISLTAILLVSVCLLDSTEALSSPFYCPFFRQHILPSANSMLTLLMTLLIFATGRMSSNSFLSFPCKIKHWSFYTSLAVAWNIYIKIKIQYFTFCNVFKKNIIQIVINGIVIL